MRLMSLSMRNYGPFRDQTIRFGDGFTAISGPNGSGKSSILQAISMCLFGTRAGRANAADIRSWSADPKSEVELVLEMRGGQNRPHRCRRSWSGAKMTISAEWRMDGQLIASGDKGVSETAQTLFGVDLTGWRVARMAEQGQVDALASTAPEKRRQMIEALLGLDEIMDRHIAVIRKQINADEARLQVLESRAEDIAELERARDALKTQLESINIFALERNIEGARARIQTGETELEDVRVNNEARAGIESEIKTIKQAIAVLDQRIKDIDAELAQAPGIEDRLEKTLADVADVSALRAEYATLAKWETSNGYVRLQAERISAKESLESQKGDVGNLAYSIEDSKRKIDDLEKELRNQDPAQPCPKCGKPYGDLYAEIAIKTNQRIGELTEDLNDSLCHIEVEKAALILRENKLVEIDGQIREYRERSIPRLKEIQGQIAHADSIDRAVRDLRDRLVRIEDYRVKRTVSATDLEAQKTELSKKNGLLGMYERIDMTLYETAVRKARADLDLAQKALARAQADQRGFEVQIAGMEERIKKADSERLAVLELRNTVASQKREEIALNTWRKSEITRIRPVLEQYAGKFLAEATGGRYSNLTLDESMQSSVRHVDGQVHEIGTHSGGETGAVALAIRLSLSAITAQGHPGPILLDEVGRDLNADWSQNMVRMLTALKSTFPQILLSTHNDTIKELADHQILVETDWIESRVLAS